MALRRLTEDEVYRIYLASPLAFADWRNPTSDELNANPDNDPNGLIFNITCAVNTDGTTFSLGESEKDESLSFCQSAGDQERMAENAEVTLEIFRATEETRLQDPAQWNAAHLAFTLLAWRGVEYFAIMSVGEAPDAAFEPGHRIKMAEIATDWGVNVIGTGENARLSNDTAARSRVNWNYNLTA